LCEVLDGAVEVFGSEKQRQHQGADGDQHAGEKAFNAALPIKAAPQR
jgi:hypothetical protein